MKFIKKKKSRKFKVNNRIFLKDCGKIYLNSDEQVTFVRNKSEYEIVKKDWGYYATPSINNRLKNFNFRSFITQNLRNFIYINIVHKENFKSFKQYLKDEKMTIVKEITNGLL